MEQWHSIIKDLGGLAIMAAAFAWVVRKAVDTYLAGRLDRHKGDLERITAEHSVRFQHLHAQRAESIRDFYAMVVKLDESLASTLAFFQVAGATPLAEKVRQLGEDFNAARTYFIHRRIYFSATLSDLVEDKVLGVAKGIFYDITACEIDPEHPQYKYDRRLLGERHSFWEKARATHKKEFAELKHCLEAEFRILLGIPSE